MQLKCHNFFAVPLGKQSQVFQTTPCFGKFVYFHPKYSFCKKMVLFFCLSRHFSWEIDKLKRFRYRVDIWNFSIKIPQTPLNDITTRVFCFAIKKHSFQENLGKYKCPVEITKGLFNPNLVNAFFFIFSSFGNNDSSPW